MAVSVSGLLLLSLGSVIVLASRAVPTGRETVVTAGVVERGLDLIRADLEDAIDLATNSANFLIGVPDRNADGAEEVIRYVLDGDGNLLRSQNGAADRPVLTGVKNLSFTAQEADQRIVSVHLDLELAEATPSLRTLRVTLLNTPPKR